MTRPLAVITGASSGLGESFARVLAADGFDLLLVARRIDRLEALGAELEAGCSITASSISVDLAELGAAATVATAVAAHGRAASVLLNNAGYYVDGDFLEHPWEEQRRILQVMLVTPTELVHLLLPGMVHQGSGRVLTMASIGGLLHSTPHQTLYGPIKRYSIGFSRTLAVEYRLAGVTFTAICPGFTRTEMMDHGSTARAGERLPSWAIADADQVARASWAAAKRGNKVVVPGLLNKATAASLRVLPVGLADRAMQVVFRRLTAG